MVRKLDPAGAVLWSTAFHSPGTAEPQPSGIALDAAQNIYVTGVSGQPYSNSVAVLLKFSPAGQLQWARYLAETNHSGGMVMAFAVDPAGNTTIGTFGFHGTAFVRYSSAGELQWAVHDLLTDSIDVAVDSAGNSYLGTTVSTDTGTGMRLRKLDNSGTVLWTRSVVEGPYSRLTRLVVDADGNLVVAGTANVDLFPDTVVLVLKYAPDGSRIWRTSMGGNGAETRSVSAMAIGVEGDITVVALSDDDYDPEHTSIFRLGRDGQVRYRFRESPIYFSSPSQLAVDDFGNAYITGYGGRPGTGVDVMTAKYDSRGTRQWRVYHGGPAQVWEYGAAVGADARGDIRVLAVADTLPGSGVELTLLHYVQADPAGTFRVQVVPDAAGTFHLTAPVGETFQIESSTDLRDWTAVPTNETQRLLQPGGTPFSQTPQRFFRLLRTE
jgi:hypothetical protein